MKHKIILATIMILSGIQTYSQDTIKGRIIEYEGNRSMPGATIFEKWNVMKNSSISDGDGKFKIKVDGDKRNLAISYVCCYGIKFINIPKSDKNIEIEPIKMVRYYLDANLVVGGSPLNVYSKEYLEETDKKLRMNVLENYRIEILGKKLKPYFEGRFLIFDFDSN